MASSNPLEGIFKKGNLDSIETKNEIAALLGTTPELLDSFEKAYLSVMEKEQTDNFFEVNAKQAASFHEGVPCEQKGLDEIMERIVDELIAQTIWEYDGSELPQTIKVCGFC